jgi:hypothetical protein
LSTASPIVERGIDPLSKQKAALPLDKTALYAIIKIKKALSADG